MFSYFYSFRARLLLVLAILLVTTLGVQYIINVLLSQRASVLISEQERALAVGVALALESLPTTERLMDLYKQKPDAQHDRRLLNVLSVKPNGEINDSLNPRYNPIALDGGAIQFFNLKDANIPPLVDSGSATAEVAQLLNRSPFEKPQVGAPRAFPMKTITDDGLTYIIVVLGAADDSQASPLRPAAALLPTLLVLFFATSITAVLVWRFTQPIADLAEAARRAAEGDFSYRVPAAARRDEMGQLALAFNRMNEQVGHTRELEMQVQQAERSAVVGRLASAIAHEIRNPLNYINLTLDHLRTALAPEDETKRQTFNRLAENLKTEVTRINSRISEFLKYSRPSRLSLSPLDIRPVVEDSLRIAAAQAAESHIHTTIETHHAGDLIVNGDDEALRSIFTNLMINAVHAMEQQKAGRLTVTLERLNHHARISISDTGTGIAPQHLAQIFEPYYSTKETGTGLGLAIVKKAVEDHGGAIHVDSRVNHGTTFTVDLPLA